MCREGAYGHISFESESQHAHGDTGHAYGGVFKTCMNMWRANVEKISAKFSESESEHGDAEA